MILHFQKKLFKTTFSTIRNYMKCYYIISDTELLICSLHNWAAYSCFFSLNGPLQVFVCKCSWGKTTSKPKTRLTSTMRKRTQKKETNRNTKVFDKRLFNFCLKIRRKIFGSKFLIQLIENRLLQNNIEIKNWVIQNHKK